MRRKDREITGTAEILEIIGRCQVLHLGMVDDGKAYIVPLNFGVEAQDETLIFYFHGAKNGRKMNVLSKNPQVCFEMEAEMKLYEAEVPCGWTAYYESVMGEGKVTILEEEADKIAALSCLMRCNGFEGDMEFNPGHLRATAVCKLEVTQISAKCNCPK